MLSDAIACPDMISALVRCYVMSMCVPVLLLLLLLIQHCAEAVDMHFSCTCASVCEILAGRSGVSRVAEDRSPSGLAETNRPCVPDELRPERESSDVQAAGPSSH
jgi:hypothetical protein